MAVRESKATRRPAVLVVEADDERRHELTRGLAEVGYDVTPAMTPQEGLRFAEGLGPSVIVGPVRLLEDGGAELLGHCTPGDVMERTLLLLGEADEAAELPDEVRFLPIDGLSTESVLQSVRLVLIGREIAVEADLELRSLVGDLALIPLLELVRSLNRCRFTGHLELATGTVAFDLGAVRAARLYEIRAGAARLGAGKIRGIKAFCRLARHGEGRFHVVAGHPPEEVDIEVDLPDLVVRALEESQVPLPAARSRLMTTGGGRVPTGQFATHQDLLLEVVSRCETVEELLDSVPSTDARIAQALEKMVASGLVRLERPRSAVAVVTDSTADLPPELARSHDVVVVPLSVTFGDDTLRDGIDIRARDFYHMLETEEHHPATRPPAEAELFEHFLSLLGERDVVAVHISSKLSKTLEHSRQAAAQALQEQALQVSATRRTAFELVDSNSVSMGVGLMALFAARMAARGESAASISGRLRDMRPRIQVLFVLNTLEYLERGGRIGKAQAWVGKVLGIKPILGVAEGEIAPVDQVRGGRQAHPRMVKLFAKRLDDARPVVAAVAHARAPVWADRLRALLEERFEVLELIETDIGPVVGTHAGPGTVGAVVFQPDEDERSMIAPLD